MKKIAAIDIGTNSFHMIIAYLDNKDRIQIIERARKVLRLNFNNQSNIISLEAIQKAIYVIEQFKKLSQKHKAELKAVATSAVREAKNKKEFVQEIYNKTKINIEVIDGKREAELIYLAVRKSLSLSNEKALCIDIGGGSTEIIIGSRDKIIFAESLKIGAVRLKKMFFNNSIITKENIYECKNYIEKELSEVVEKIKKIKRDLVIGTSGTINSVALMNNAMHNKSLVKNELNGISFSLNDLEIIQKNVLSCKTIEDRKKIKGLEEKRADVISAGIIILHTLFKLLDIKKITISGFALREGIVIDYLRK